MERHEGPCMGMVYAVDTVPQIVHITGNAHKFHHVGVIAELLQDFAGRDGHFSRMLLRMVRISQGIEDLVALF